MLSIGQTEKNIQNKYNNWKKSVFIFVDCKNHNICRAKFNTTTTTMTMNVLDKCKVRHHHQNKKK